MSVFVYRRKPSTGATDLAEALDAVRFRARTRTIEQAAKRGDTVICWGEPFAGKLDVKVLNGAPLRNKYQDATALQAAGVSTITVSLTRPPAEAPAPPPLDPVIAAFLGARNLAEAFADMPDGTPLRTPVFIQGVNELYGSLGQLYQALQRPAPIAVPVVPKVWIPRNNNHMGGNDLLTPTQAPDYFVVKEAIVREFRIHSFLGKSIRAGIKAPRDGFTLTGPTAVASTWIRSWDGGWRIKYDGVSSKKKHRELAHAAVKALGLDFGAVDIGERADGSLIVLEVNRAPGLVEGTIDVYTQAIQRWIDGETPVETDNE